MTRPAPMNREKQLGTETAAGDLALDRTHELKDRFQALGAK
jgi:hypothetical protein